MRWALVLLLPALLILAGCEREDRDTRPNPMTGETHEKIALTSLSPGDTPPEEQVTGIAAQYVNNAFHVSQGKKWFAAFNCNGCHANGGGGSGPPLMDDKWSYGGKIENIVASIREGRPNGMPSWRGKITDDQIWELAAYVLSMSGNVSSDVAPGRNDDMAAKPPENTMSSEPIAPGGLVPKSGEMPQ
jgi:cytochrome c oxidase cbb3-type subunit 3